MPKPYSYDFRQKVLEAIELDGMPKTEAAQVFHISRNTINLWLTRKADTGDFAAKSNRSHQSHDKITDWEQFRRFVEANGDKTQAQMAELWPTDISSRTIARALRKIGFTRKKNLRLPGT